MIEVIYLLIGAALLVWSILGVAVGCEYIFEIRNNYKQKIFVCIIGGPFLWILMPCLAVVFGIAWCVTSIYDSLGDKK